MSEPRRWHELVLPIGIILCLIVILVPLPPALMDVLLAANITIAIIVLLTTIHVKVPLEFAIFPTLLLATTLGRVVLNIATTRLILSRGAIDNSAAAGGVIQSFGEFVAGNQIMVGVIIFAIIVVVQFVIITAGATRISEVAARFTLDGMPGRQMAIDADLSAGTIDAATARERREQLQEQADFYGAMDGASKFVRGDAIAGLLITAINIVGGLAIGLTNGMSIPQAADTFTKLTIGDGLATQIPGLLISLSAGILISRSTRETNLPSEFISQLFTRPQVLLIAGLFLAALVFTQLPAVPLLTVGGGCLALSYLLNKQKKAQSFQSATVKPGSPADRHSATNDAQMQAVNRRLEINPLEIELGINLVGLANGSGLLSKITASRETIAEELGIILPKVRVRDNLSLGRNQYRILVNQLPVEDAEVDPEQVLAVQTAADAVAPAGEPADWHEGLSAWWIPAGDVPQWNDGFEYLPPASVIVESLKHHVRQRAGELLNRQATAYLIDQLRATQPAVVDELIPDVLRLGQVQQVLQLLLAEGVSIRPLTTILEALADNQSRASDVVALGELVRRRLSRWITASCANEQGVIRTLELGPDLQIWLEQRIVFQDGQYSIRLDAAALERLVQWFSQHVEASIPGRRQPVCLVNATLRAALRTVLMTRFSQLSIISHQEISGDAKIETIAILKLADVEYAAA